MINAENVIKKIEEEIHLGEHWDESYRMIDLSLLRETIALIKEQEEKIQELKSMNAAALFTVGL